jgi:hypothetical protein
MMSKVDIEKKPIPLTDEQAFNVIRFLKNLGNSNGKK